MRPVDELRDRFQAARRRAEIQAARAAVVAEARAVVPELPREADAGHLERAARRLLRRAAQDEFAREGQTPSAAYHHYGYVLNHRPLRNH